MFLKHFILNSLTCKGYQVLNHFFFFVVRCHILEVDLATQFSPYMMEAIRSTEQNCQKCVKTISKKCQQTQENCNLSVSR